MDVTPKIAQERLPAIPNNWQILDLGPNAFRVSRRGLIVAVTIAKYDGALWQHMVLHRPKRDPTFEDVERVRRTFVPKDKRTVLVLPKPGKVNAQRHTWHLYVPLEVDPMPSFSLGAEEVPDKKFIQHALREHRDFYEEYLG